MSEEAIGKSRSETTPVSGAEKKSETDARVRDIEKTLLDSAAKNRDPEQLLKVLQALNTIREIDKVKKEQSWPGIVLSLTPVISVLIAALTVIISFHQEKEKAKIEWQKEQDERTEAIRKAKADDYSAWRDVIKNVKLDDPSSVQMGLFTLQGFLDAKSDHAAEARSIAITLLPLTANEDGFDVIFSRLRSQTSKANQSDLIAIDKKVSSLENDAMVDAINGNPARPHCAKKLPKLFFQSEECFEEKRDFDKFTLNRIWLYSWELDTVSSGLASLWKQVGTDSRPADVPDQKGIILENQDFSGLDFSGVDLSGSTIHYCDLRGAKFDHAKLTGATFHTLRGFSGSTWNDANWQDAAILPCNLLEDLSSRYPQAGADDLKRLKASCTGKTQAKDPVR